MSKKIFLSLAIHNHQPVGNFDFVFEEAYRVAYLPMIEALERHPAVRLALHYTGPLRDWLVEHHPDFLPRVRALVERGQVEIMTGGYYEPILASIPDADKYGQICKLTQAVKTDFGYEASGAWLAERVWEPHLAKPLAEAGVEYTIVDDTHFKYVGLRDEDLFGYYVTEEQGVPLKIFGTSKHLRYVIPWHDVEEVIAWLWEQADESGTKVAVMGDDGEKFGLWPGTFEYCWQDDHLRRSLELKGRGEEAQQVAVMGWVERFFTAIEENSDWLEMITPGEAARRLPALGRIYLPTASYDEMTEWALPPEESADIVRLKHRLQEEGREDILRFVKGGFWRNFLVKYPEINTMHKKMLWVSDKVHAWKRDTEGVTTSEEIPVCLPRSLEKALDHLWAAQCNCPYWHGVFGGFYLFHIRSANYRHLIEAENLADAARHGPGPWVEWQAIDFDRDAADELLLSSDALNLYFDLAEGGSLFEWDWRAKGVNLLNVMSRRPEGYHRELREAAARGQLVIAGQEGELTSIHATLVRVKEPGLAEKLHYDWYRRASFLDHFLHPETMLEAFARAQYGELGDFVNQPYAYAVEQGASERLIATLSREGHVWHGDLFAPLRVEKRFTLQGGQTALEAVYRLTNRSEAALSLRFGVETNWAMLGGNGPGAYYAIPGQEPVGLDTTGESNEAASLRLVLEWMKIVIGLRFSRPATLWRFPIETITASEAGYERGYQGSCLMPLWEVQLAPGECWEVSLHFELREL